MSPTRRSLAKLRAEGYFAVIVEHWNPWSRTRSDLLGFGDILAIRGDEMLMVQTTSSGVSSRVKKIQGLDTLKVWCAANRRVVVHGWVKRGKRGEAKKWTCREVWISADGSTREEKSPG